MKTVNLFLAGLAALAVSNPASADVSIRLTGSTAFRSNTHTALITPQASGGLGFTQMAYTGITATGTASASGAKYAIYERGVSPNKTTIKTSWAGSVGGILTVVEQRTDVKWLPDIGPPSAVVSGSANNESLAQTDNTPPDIAFSDCFQASTQYKLPLLTSIKCGINQFRMVTNYGPGGVNPITSINSQQVRALFTSNSGLPLSIFTGNPADTAKVYGIGRDPDSGTRVTLLAETGMGPTATVVHWEPTTSGTTVTALAPWHPMPLFGTNLEAGNSGYASGGDLAKVMRLDTASVVATVAGVPQPAAPCYFIAAVSKGDADTAIGAVAGGGGAGNAKVIAFNNSDSNTLTSTQVADNIKNGVYSLWGYLHCMHNGLANEKLSFYTELTNLLIASTSSGIKLSDMKVQRLIDGATATVVP